MDVLTTIKHEHRQVSDLFDEADKCEPGDQRLFDLAHEIERQLSMHLAIEERLFYGELKRRAEDQEQQVDVFEAYTEHAVAKTLMQMLQSGRKPDEQFKAELQVLGESVKHHVEEEESKVFGIAKDVLDHEELDAIGAAWERAKQRALQRDTNGSARKTARKKSPARASRTSTSRKKAAKKRAPTRR